MRILQVSSAPSLGGGEVHLIELARKLRERGHDVAVAGRRSGPLEADFELPFANAMDVYTAYRLRRIVLVEGFDLVHAHVARDYPIAAAALWRLEGPRLVSTRQLIFPVKRHPLYSRVDGWIATTGQILDSIQHLRPKASAVIPNWVDTNRMPYRERPVHTPFVVGLLGQVSPHKGHDDAVEAMRRLGAGFCLRIGGRGRAEYVQRLKERAAGLPVDFLGFVQPREFLDQADVLIVPSWEEPFGIVILEAMAAGVNVIATDAGGPPEILDHGAAGLLVPPRNPGALAAAIRRLASEEDLRRSLRRRALERVRARYDIESAVPRIEAFYRRLLDR